MSFNGGIYTRDTGETPTSINDLSNEITQLSLSPNPAVDQFQLQFDYHSDETLQIEVVNSSGQAMIVETYYTVY